MNRRQPAEFDAREAQSEMIKQRISRLTGQIYRSPDYLRAIADALDLIEESADQVRQLRR